MTLRRAKFLKDVGTLSEGARLRYTEIADRTARRDGLRRGNDGVGVDAIVPVEVGDRAGLAEMLDAERPDAYGRTRRPATPASPDVRRAR